MVEIIAIKLREDNNLKGLEVKLDGRNCSLKICQLADDTTLFFKLPKDVSLAMNIIETFGSLSGLQLNRNKTEGFWLGKLKMKRSSRHVAVHLPPETHRTCRRRHEANK